MNTLNDANNDIGQFLNFDSSDMLDIDDILNDQTFPTAQNLDQTTVQPSKSYQQLPVAYNVECVLFRASDGGTRIKAKWTFVTDQLQGTISHLALKFGAQFLESEPSNFNRLLFVELIPASFFRHKFDREMMKIAHKIKEFQARIWRCRNQKYSRWRSMAKPAPTRRCKRRSTPSPSKTLPGRLSASPPAFTVSRLSFLKRRTSSHSAESPPPKRRLSLGITLRLRSNTTRLI